MQALAHPQEDVLNDKSFLISNYQNAKNIIGYPKVTNILKYNRGQTILFEDDVILYLYEIISGTVKTYTLLNDGRRLITGFYAKGDILGLPIDGRYYYSAEAITETTVGYYTLTKLQQIMKSSPDLTQNVIKMAYRELVKAHEQMISLGRKKPDERIATFLLNCQKWTMLHSPSNEILLDLPMSRLDIADYLGLTQETVCRVFSKFNRAGLITLLRSGKLIINDHKKLSCLAE